MVKKKKQKSDKYEVNEYGFPKRPLWQQLISIVCIVAIACLVGWMFYKVGELQEFVSCKNETKVLVGINGVTDEDSAILGPGDTHMTTLLFKDDTVIMVPYRIQGSLQLNKNIKISQCKRGTGEIVYTFEGLK